MTTKDESILPQISIKQGFVSVIKLEMNKEGTSGKPQINLSINDPFMFGGFVTQVMTEEN